MRRRGYPVAGDRIALAIGKGGDKLVPSILGEGIAKKQSKKLAEAHDEAFAKIAKSTRFTLFPGVRKLLGELRQVGFKTALAISSGMESLAGTGGFRAPTASDDRIKPASIN